MALFRRKKKESEQDTAETEAVVAEAPDAGDDGAGSTFIPESAEGAGAAPPPTPATRVDPPPDEEAEKEEEAAPTATATVEEEPQPAPEPEPERAPEPEPAPEAPESPLAAHAAVEHDPFEQRPEVFVGAAFAGGFLLAQLLKWVGEEDE